MKLDRHRRHETVWDKPFIGKCMTSAVMLTNGTALDSNDLN